MDVDENDTHSVSATSENTVTTEQYQPSQPSRTPTPDIDPESYTAWGREHFGEEWYRQRKTYEMNGIGVKMCIIIYPLLLVAEHHFETLLPPSLYL
ncbi:hypothetical protein ABKA04_004600 [Annulohypoxylon sp. FPYF3050]